MSTNDQDVKPTTDPTGPVESRDRRSVVQSVDRALDVLDLLRDAVTPVSAADLAKAAGFDRTVVYRLLRTLAQRDMVSEVDGAFALGPAALLLGQRYLDILPLRRIALPYMVDLQEKVLRDQPWTLALAMAVGNMSSVIERMWTPATPLGLVLEVGDTLPLHQSAAGRAMLAHGSATSIGNALSEHPDLESILEDIRTAGGVALVDGSTTSGLQAVACAIRGPGGTATAAIGIGGLDLGDGLAHGSPLAVQLRHAAEAIGRLTR